MLAGTPDSDADAELSPLLMSRQIAFHLLFIHSTLLGITHSEEAVQFSW